MKTYAVPGRPPNFAKLIADLRRLDYAVASIAIDAKQTTINLKDEETKDPTEAVAAMIANRPVAEKKPEPPKPPEVPEPSTPPEPPAKPLAKEPPVLEEPETKRTIPATFARKFFG